MAEQKRKILFVDDDVFVLRGYKRSLMQYANEWEPYFATNGREAVQLLSQILVDVLVTDMRMPGLDGNGLLEYVSHNFPEVIRFVLSGNIEETKSLATAHLAHQLIPKPCDMGKLHQMIEQTCHLRDLLSNPNLARMVTGVKKIPPLPTLYGRLISELQSDEPATRVIGEIVSQDVAMTAKVLQLVNSAFFGMPGAITNPQKAVTILGINTIKTLVLGSYIFSEYQGYGSRHISIDTLWYHSLVVSNLSKAIAQAAGLDHKKQGEAQLAGMLHDIGKLLQLSITGFFQPLEFDKNKVKLSSEYNAYGTSHAELGAYLLALWGLPQTIIEAAAYHHFPSRLGSAQFGVISALHTANGLFHLEMDSDKNSEFSKYLDLDHLLACQVLPNLNDWRQLTRKMLEDAKRI